MKRFMKGIYELCPSLPRYTATCGLSTVWTYFRRSASVSVLSLKELTFKSNRLSFWHTQRMRKKLCVIKHLQEYTKKTQVLPSDCSQLLLSHVRPHGPTRKATISRWCKNVLKSAGIGVSKFTAHSTRSASTSFWQRGMSISKIS